MKRRCNRIVLQLVILGLSWTGIARCQEEGKEFPQIRRLNPASHAPYARIDLTTAHPSPTVASIQDISSFATGLNGLYIIPGDFADLSTAVAVLDSVGISGDVTFELADSSYSVPSALTFTNFPNAGSAEVTLRPASGTAVTISFQADSSEGKGFAFDAAKKITIDGIASGGASLTLRYAGGVFPHSDPFASTIFVTGGSDWIEVLNTSIEGQMEGTWLSQTASRAAIFVWDDGVSNSNITIDHCTITNASYGLKVLSNPAHGQGPLTFTNNNVGDAFGEPVMQGVLTDMCTGLTLSNNTFDGISFVQYYFQNQTTEYDLVGSFPPANSFFYDFVQMGGAHIFFSDPTSVVAYNVVKNVVQPDDISGFSFFAVYGLSIRGSGPSALVHDNRISGIGNSDLDGRIVGLRSESGSIHNSIRLTGTMAGTQLAYCLRPDGGNFYNNALSNEMTGGSAANRRCLSSAPVGNSNNNAMYSTGQISTQATLAGYLATGKDLNSVFGPVNFFPDLHIIPGASSAENIGMPNVLFAADIDGMPRDTTTAGSRDAGADEFPESSMPLGTDVLPVTIDPPTPQFILLGEHPNPVVSVKNNSNIPTGAFNVALSVSDGYNQTVSVSLNPREYKSVTFPTWSPANVGSYSISVTTLLAADENTANDTLMRQQLVYGGDPVIGDTLFDWDTGTEGWTATGDFVRSNSFSKLSGPFSGYSWVTKSTGNYTDATASMLMSPWLNLTTIGGDGNIYFSFFQSLRTEPSWDRSWMQYSTDGSTWKMLGVLNDPNGVSWYGATCVDENAAGNTDCWDVPDSLLFILDSLSTPPPGWSSNGDCTGADVPTGPDGYVYCALRITPSSYPDIIGSTNVKFRFVAFADGKKSFEGWAIDNLRIGGTGPVLCVGNILGNVYSDLDGNGVKNGAESGIPGVPVELRAYGCLVGIDTTDANGDYDLTLGGPPGVYSVTVQNPPGISQPTAGFYSLNYFTLCQTYVNRNFGIYDGSISGTVFEDYNNNGAHDDGMPLSSFIIEARKDSSNGLLIRSDTSALNGSYLMPVGAGTFYLNQVPPPGFVARQTSPATTYHVVTVSGTSGSPTSHQTGIDFGNFELNQVNVSLFIDHNGNGIKDAEDTDPMPAPFFEVYDYTKNALVLTTDTLGNAIASRPHVGQDTGAYLSTKSGGSSPGWIHTTGDTSLSVVVAQSGMTKNIIHLVFELGGASGHVYNDLNGDGTRNIGEPAMPGWEIRLTGSHYGSSDTVAVSDSTGFWSIDSISGGSHSLQAIVQAGWLISAPGSGSHTFAGMSGLNEMNRDFGVYYAGLVTQYDSVKAGWNLVSLPLTISDRSVHSIFPNAITDAFSYAGTYKKHDSLVNGIGYWIKFASPDVAEISGFRRMNDTVTILKGWNLIGSFHIPIAASTIPSTPTGILVSNYYGYDDGYHVVDSLHPGKAYWIKSSASGIIVLSAYGGGLGASISRAKAENELPPPPPDRGDGVIDDPEDGVASFIPKEFALEQNYPNPFNPSTTIRYALPVESRVSLKVYDVAGREVVTLVDGVEAAGLRSVEWRGDKFSTGIYICRIRAGSFTASRKLLLIR